MKNLLVYFKKSGGFKYIKNLFFEGLLFYAFLLFLFIPKNRAGLKQFEEILSNKRLLSYRRKFRKIFQNYDHSKVGKNLQPESKKIIWFLWLQGLDTAPPVVKSCYKVLVDKLHDYKIILLTADNIGNYVSLPNFIFEKWQNGRITNTHFSDILRLELLIVYGGIWMDSTVLLMQDRIPQQIENADLFYFQVLQPGYMSINISSWFMSAKPNNPVLCLARECIYAYWKKNNKLYNYFLLHYCLVLASEIFPQVYNKIPKYSNAPPHVLQSEFFDSYSEDRLSEITQMCFVQKLTYKFDKDISDFTGTFYSKIMNDGTGVRGE